MKDSTTFNQCKHVSIVRKEETSWGNNPKWNRIFFPQILKAFWTSGNISSIDSSTLEPFKKFSRIFLNSNKLVSFNSDLFQRTRKLQMIHFDGNKLQRVGHNLLAGLACLTRGQQGSETIRVSMELLLLFFST